MNCCKRLVKRNNVYYIRARIPDSVQHLAKTAQFFYSLKTYNYYEALAKAREESYKIDLKINLLKGLDMKIKNGELLLDDVDIDREVILPDALLPFTTDIERICFRENDADLSDINTLFVFGSVSGLENMKNAIFHVLEKAPITMLIISGGISKKTAPLSEAEVIFNAIKDKIPTHTKVILEQEATNTKENVEFSLKKCPTLQNDKLCFISKYFAAGRSFLTLKKFLPEALIKQYAFVTSDCAPKQWINREKSKSLVCAELIRIFTYGERGDIFYDSVKEEVEAMRKKLL